MLHAPPPKVRYGYKIPEVKASTTNQELSNAYKQIKAYEYQINKIRSLNNEGTFVEQYLLGLFRLKKTEVLLK